MNRKNVTSTDVARRAGVSQSTVSMILNKKYNVSFSRETVMKVEEAARELGYSVEKKQRKTVKRLGGILKLADGFVRGDKHQIKDIKLEYNAVDNIVKIILTPLECGLPDIDCAIRKRDLFEVGFKCQSVILVAHE